jgi:hypothetical protein
MSLNGDCENIKLETEKGLLEDSKLACDYFKTFINTADVIINKTALTPAFLRYHTFQRQCTYYHQHHSGKLKGNFV